MLISNTKYCIKAILLSFCLILASYSVCSYANIDRFLQPAENGLFNLVVGSDSVGAYLTEEEAGEIAVFIRGNRLSQVCLHFLPWSVEENVHILQIILGALAENTSISVFKYHTRGSYNMIGRPHELWYGQFLSFFVLQYNLTLSHL